MARMSSLQLAKRALVTSLLAFARQYVVPSLGISRDPSDPDVEKAFKKIVRKVHPDKGGSVRDAQKLHRRKVKEQRRTKTEYDGKRQRRVLHGFKMHGDTISKTTQQRSKRFCRFGGGCF